MAGRDPIFRYPIDVLSILGAYIDPITGAPTDPDRDEIESWMALRERSLEDYISQRASMPTGGAVPYFAQVLSSDPPTGWIIPYGADQSRVAYPYLFGALGTLYGVGDSLTTFGTPDLRGRIPVGLDNMGGTDGGRLSVALNTLGATGGEETHVLTVAELAAHDHGIAASIVGMSAGGTGIVVLAGAGGVQSNVTGSSTAHNNMQPYVLTNWLLKT